MAEIKVMEFRKRNNQEACTMAGLSTIKTGLLSLFDLKSALSLDSHLSADENLPPRQMQCL